MSSSAKEQRSAPIQEGGPSAQPPGPEHKPSILHQPVAVWAIAFACMVSFMGIGLVDPILPAISKELQASPGQTMLLFTSYLVITGIAMLFTGWFSSRAGIRNTLLIGLVLIVLFAALAGSSGTVSEIIGFRAGWGLGNALFISTALSAIVGAATGGSKQAVMLYEAALGIGMALGPLLGGVLGSLSWRGPFFGTAVLMGIGFLAILVLLRAPSRAKGKADANASAPQRHGIAAGLTALKDPALRTLAGTAIGYNFAFFVLLAYSPYPVEAAARRAGMDFGAHELGFVFFGWGLALAVASVFLAPILTRTLGLMRVLYSGLVLLAVVMVLCALLAEHIAALIVLIVVAGLLQGVMNTSLTETVMEATDLPRSIASSTYSGVRFLGGSIAPAVAGPLAAAFGAGAPYWLGMLVLLAAVAVLAVGARHLHRVTRPHESPFGEAEAISLGSEA